MALKAPALATGGSRLRHVHQAFAAAPGTALAALAACAHAIVGWVAVGRLCAAAKAVTLAVKAKLVLSFALIVAQIGDVYQVRYPDGYQSFTSRLFSPLRLQLLGWFPGLHWRCFGGTTLAVQLLAYCLMPLALVMGAL